MKTLITTSLILLLVGCGSRKAEVENLKAEIKAQREKMLSIQNNIQSNVHLTKVANKTTIEPIDKDKISTFDGTSFQNARITKEETKTDSTAYLNDNSKVDLKVDEEKETSVKTKDKKSESKKPNPYLWMGLFLVVGLVIWLKPWK